MIIPEYAKGDQELWTPKLVKEALVGAIVVIELTSGRVGPSGVKCAWPEFTREFLTKEELAFEHIQAKNDRPRHRRISSKQIQRAELVMFGGKTPKGPMKAWLAGPMTGYPDLQRKLTIWCLNEMKKELGRRSAPIRQICIRKKWAYSTFNYQRDKAAGMIAERLNRHEVDIW